MDDKNLERIKTDLYKKEFSQKHPNIIPDFSSGEREVPTEWTTPPQREIKTKRFTMFQKFFFASIAFFLIALGVAGFIFFSGGNIVSSENVDIVVLGPISVAGGEELSLQISVANKNKADMQNTDIIIEYPEGTRTADGSTSLPRVRKSLDTIHSGEIVTEVFKSSLYGNESSEKGVKISVEYRVSGSNAIFTKETEYKTTLSSAPLSLSVGSLSEVVSGQETTFRVSIASNATTPVDDVLLHAEYPSGFQFVDSDPKPRYGSSVWDLGTIAPGKTTTVVITGIVNAQDEETKILSMSVGRRDERDERSIGAIYGLSSAELTVKRPFLSMDAHIGGSKEQSIVVDGGQRVTVEIDWSNNLTTRVSDVTVTADLTGFGFDESSVSVSRGVYRSGENKVVWNKDTNGDFNSIEAGQSGSVAFSFVAQTGSGNTQYINPRMKATFNISGRRLSDSGTMEDVSSVLTREVKVNSDIRLASRAIYYSGPFVNTGPMPPKAESQTTYTVIWTAANASNDVAGAVVRGTLPPSVSWLSKVSPPSATQDISYDPKTGDVTWRVGDLKAGTGFSRQAPEITFQVGLTPSISDVGSIPNLISKISISGKDLFTNKVISVSKSPLTTNLTTDSSFLSEYAEVVK